ncbi:MAG: hypothetical protein QXF82_10580 [Nitrososphaeria archaeon]
MIDEKFLITTTINIFIMGLGLMVVKFYVEHLVKEIYTQFSEKLRMVNENVKIVINKIDKVEERLTQVEKNNVKTQTDVSYLQRRLEEWEERE